MLSPAALADRDGPACWLCGNDVDPAAPRGAREAGSVDHVVPRAKGGGDEDENLRLAHRVCNSRRGSRLPELAWPPEVPVVDHAEIWPVVRRAVRRPGEWEVVGVVVGDDGRRAAQDWLGRAVPEVLGGDWEVQARPLGPGLTSLALRTTGPARRLGRRRGRRR